MAAITQGQAAMREAQATTEAGLAAMHATMLGHTERVAEAMQLANQAIALQPRMQAQEEVMAAYVQQLADLQAQVHDLQVQLSHLTDNSAQAQLRTYQQVSSHQFQISNGMCKVVLRHDPQRPPLSSEADILRHLPQGALPPGAQITAARQMGAALWEVTVCSRPVQQQLIQAWCAQFGPGAARQWAPTGEQALRNATRAFLDAVVRMVEEAPQGDTWAAKLRALHFGMYRGEPCVAIRPGAGQAPKWHKYPLAMHVPGGTLFG